MSRPLSATLPRKSVQPLPPARPDPQWLDAMYNNRALVPDHAVHMQHWADASRAARQSLHCRLDLRYGDGPGETLDVFPGAAADAPVFVFIHGGYWRALDKSDHSFLAAPLVAQGACVVVVNYALSPAVSVPGMLMQTVRALAWTWRHIRDHGGDPARITVAGHSVGGHAAAMLLDGEWQAFAEDLPADLVKNALSVSGIHDLEPLAAAPFMASVGLTAEQVRQASPARLPPPRQGRLYTVCGGDESAEFQRQNRLIQTAWGRRLVPVCESLPGLNHFTIVSAFADPAHRLNRLALDLLGLRPL